MLIYVLQLTHGRWKENGGWIFKFPPLLPLSLFKLHLGLFINTYSHIIPVILVIDHGIYLKRPVKQRLWSPQEGYTERKCVPRFCFPFGSAWCRRRTFNLSLGWYKSVRLMFHFYLREKNNFFSSLRTTLLSLSKYIY